MFKNLREYIAALDAAGELVRVSAEVDPILEIAEITDRESKRPRGGRALLFENTGTHFPVITNMMGSERRIAMALGVASLDELNARVEMLLSSALSPKDNIIDKLRMLPLLGEMSRWLPRKVRGRGECQQVVLQGNKATLALLPILKCWPHDAAQFITLPLVNTIDPDSGARNVGMYRMQVIGEHSTGMHWHMHKTGERHYAAYKRRGEMMPVSVCIGGDPAYTYAATAPMPDNMDEYLLAGFLRRRAVRLVRCVTNNIYVPEDCDFVIEGYVDPCEDKFMEGPFGDHTGFYSLEDLYPKFHITAITHRREAIYPATIVGVPPQEDVYIAQATEKIFLAPIRFAMQPEVIDLYMPPAGVAHNIALVDIAANYPGQAFKVAGSMWGAGQMMFNKFLVVTALPTNESLRDNDTVARLLRRVSVPDDVMFARGVLDVLDHTAQHTGTGGKMMVNATVHREPRALKLPSDNDIKLCGGIASADFALAEQWGAIVLYCRAGVQPHAEEFMRVNAVEGVNVVLIVEGAVKSLTNAELLWIATANADAMRDIKVCGDFLVVDSRTKLPEDKGMPRRFPNVVAASRQTINLVDSRWAEYGLGEFTASPSLRYIPLLQSDKARI